MKSGRGRFPCPLRPARPPRATRSQTKLKNKPAFPARKRPFSRIVARGAPRARNIARNTEVQHAPEPQRRPLARRAPQFAPINASNCNARQHPTRITRIRPPIFTPHHRARAEQTHRDRNPPRRGKAPGAQATKRRPGFPRPPTLSARAVRTPPRTPNPAKPRHRAPSLQFCRTKPPAILAPRARPARHTAQHRATPRAPAQNEPRIPHPPAASDPPS